MKNAGISHGYPGGVAKRRGAKNSLSAPFGAIHPADGRLLLSRKRVRGFSLFFSYFFNY